MANTYSKIYIHVVFAVKERYSCIPPIYQSELFSYISGIINGLGHYSLAVGGTDNHVHILMSYKPDMKLSDTMREIKANSSKFINQKHWLKCRFEWQRGYAAFSYSHSQIDAVIKYIMKQPIHHHNMTLEDEIKQFMSLYEIEYDERYRIQDV